MLQVATILREYKIQHAEVILKEDCTEDDFIDVLEGFFFFKNDNDNAYNYNIHTSNSNYSNGASRVQFSLFLLL